MTQALDLSARLARARKDERWLAAYRSHPEVFAAFEAAEDPGGLVSERLHERLAEGHGAARKTVLELGGGTGWLTRRMAPLAGRYLVMEPSARMLAVGRVAEAYRTAALFRARGEHLPVYSGSMDAVLASFVLLDLRPELRSLVLAEASRVLAEGPGSAVWVVENHGTGEYQELRGIADDETGLGEVRPLVDELGFELTDVIETRLEFPSEDEATHVLGTILGERVRRELERAPRRSLGLNLALLRWTKQA